LRVILFNIRTEKQALLTTVCDIILTLDFSSDTDVTQLSDMLRPSNRVIAHKFNMIHPVVLYQYIIIKVRQ